MRPSGEITCLCVSSLACSCVLSCGDVTKVTGNL
jgi:hypothetical protein